MSSLGGFPIVFAKTSSSAASLSPGQRRDPLKHGKISKGPAGSENLRVEGGKPTVIGVMIVTLAILASAAIVAPFFYSNPHSVGPGAIRFAHDLAIHRSVMEHFDNMLRSSSLYPRWLSDVNYGYGNAWPNFYQPGFYFLTSLVHSITHNWVNTIFIITALGLAGSGLAFYALARLFFGRPASAIAATAYSLLPYHLLDVFWRGALPEYLSFVLLPLIFYFFYKVGRKGQVRDYAGLGLVYGLCLMTHVPIGYLLSFLLVFHGLAWAASERDWRIVCRIALGMTLGTMLSAIYWLPAVTEIKHASETVTQLFAYHSNYITQETGEPRFDHLIRETFALQSIAFLVIVSVLGLLEWRTGARPDPDSTSPSPRTKVWTIMGLLALFMNLPQSYYLARLIPNIEIVAFPWRWLVFVCLFTALLAAAVVERLVVRFNRSGIAKWRYLASTVATIAAIGVNIWFAGQYILIGSLENPMMVPDVEFVSDSYCPKGAPVAATLPRTERVTIESGSGSSELIQWTPLYRKAVITANMTTTVRFKTFNFPGWSARVDGVDASMSSDAFGAQLVKVQEGTHTVEVRFASTFARNLGVACSIIGFFLVCALTPGRRLRVRHGPVLNAGLADQLKSGKVVAFTDAPQAEGIFESPASEAREAFNGKAKVRRVVTYCMFGVFIAAGVFAVVMLVNEIGAPYEGGLPEDRTILNRSAIGVGSDAKLVFGGSNVVTVAADELSLREVIDAVSQRDAQKTRDLLQSRKAFNVERDTKVRILGLAGGKSRVEILEGSAASRVGWVLEGWLK